MFFFVLTVIELHIRRKILRYTNNFNLPEAVYLALTRDTYNKGNAHYSVTEILNPPQLVQLKRRYLEELEEDVMNNVWSLLGKAAHHILEQHAPEDSLSEERLSVTVCDRILSGQTDNYHNKIITDYKITSAWTLVYGSRLKEWEEQLNTYAYIFGEHGYEVTGLQIVAILRDWDKNKAASDRVYPQTPIVVVPLNLWDKRKQYEFVSKYVGRQVGAEEVAPEELPPCSAEDMWEQPTKYAVMKIGRKTAVRVFENEELAKEHAAGMSDEAGNSIYIQVRPGIRTRCSRYCPVSKYCHQYKEYKANANRNPTEEEN